MYPDSRVSLPSTIFGRVPTGCARGFNLRKTCAAARPSLSAVSAVTGSTLATPRTPSVPKIFLLSLTRLIQRPDVVFVNRKLWGNHRLGSSKAEKIIQRVKPQGSAGDTSQRALDAYRHLTGLEPVHDLLNEIGVARHALFCAFFCDARLLPHIPALRIHFVYFTVLSAAADSHLCGRGSNVYHFLREPRGD